MPDRKGLVPRSLKNTERLLLAGYLVTDGSQLLADGTVVDKVYHPYVDALENEMELRILHQDPDPSIANPQQIHRLSLGRSITDRVFAELYAVGEKSRTSGYDLEAWELEVKWQLTEQGQYDADWGLLFEFENEFGNDLKELGIGLLTEKEFGRFSAAANLKVVAEWGEAIKDEIETEFATQIRYRLSRSFEPAMEFYAGQDYVGAGPVAGGQLNLGIRKNLSWEAGFIFGLDQNSPDQTLRLLFEFEF